MYNIIMQIRANKLLARICIIYKTCFLVIKFCTSKLNLETCAADACHHPDSLDSCKYLFPMFQEWDGFLMIFKKKRTELIIAVSFKKSCNP